MKAKKRAVAGRASRNAAMDFDTLLEDGSFPFHDRTCDGTNCYWWCVNRARLTDNQRRDLVTAIRRIRRCGRGKRSVDFFDQSRFDWIIGLHEFHDDTQTEHARWTKNLSAFDRHASKLMEIATALPPATTQLLDSVLRQTRAAIEVRLAAVTENAAILRQSDLGTMATELLEHAVTRGHTAAVVAGMIYVFGPTFPASLDVLDERVEKARQRMKRRLT
jgi:hypothetical protein